MRKLIFFVGITLLLTACFGERVERQLTREPYFDLAGFMQGQIDSLAAADARVRKAVVLNEGREEKTVEIEDFGQELAVFVNSDINRPAWFDKYRVDSTYENGSLSRLHYQAQDSTLRTRELIIDWQGGQVATIHVKNFSQTVLSQTQQFLSYEPGKQYHILTNEQGVLAGDMRSEIFGRFLP